MKSNLYNVQNNQHIKINANTMILYSRIRPTEVIFTTINNGALQNKTNLIMYNLYNGTN